MAPQKGQTAKSLGSSSLPCTPVRMPSTKGKVTRPRGDSVSKSGRTPLYLPRNCIQSGTIACIHGATRAQVLKAWTCEFCAEQAATAKAAEEAAQNLTGKAEGKKKAPRIRTAEFGEKCPQKDTHFHSAERTMKSCIAAIWAAVRGEPIPYPKPKESSCQLKASGGGRPSNNICTVYYHALQCAEDYMQSEGFKIYQSPLLLENSSSTPAIDIPQTSTNIHQDDAFSPGSMRFDEDFMSESFGISSHGSQVTIQDANEVVNFLLSPNHQVTLADSNVNSLGSSENNHNAVTQSFPSPHRRLDYAESNTLTDSNGVSHQFPIGDSASAVQYIDPRSLNQTGNISSSCQYTSRGFSATLAHRSGQSLLSAQLHGVQHPDVADNIEGNYNISFSRQPYGGHHEEEEQEQKQAEVLDHDMFGMDDPNPGMAKEQYPDPNPYFYYDVHGHLHFM